MIETLLGAGAKVLFILAVGCFFASATMLWMVVLEKGQDFLEGYRETFTSTASTTLSDMFLFVDPQRLFKYNLIAIIVLPLLSWLVFRDFGATLAVLGIVIFLPATVYRTMRARRMKKFEAQLPDALLMVSGAMRAGASLSIALEGLVKEQPPPVSQEFELYLKEQRLGVDFEQSLRSMEERNPMQDFRMLVTALRINREVGGNLAETMETLGDTLRRKAMMEGKIQSLTAQGKLQGIVMTGLPILLGFLLNFMEPDAMSKLWTTPIGWALLVVILIMESMGYFLIKKITTIDV
jgi:tight adherence protein B